MGRELDHILGEFTEEQERDARKELEAKLMWHVIAAIHDHLVDNGRCEIASPSSMADVIAEIVNRVEERA